MNEKPIWWAEKNSDGSYTVDTSKLLFSIILDELAIADCIRKADDEGKIIPKERITETWKAKILNLRKTPIMTVVRASYHCFYRPVNNEYSWRDGWKNAWNHAKYLFTINLEEKQQLKTMQCPPLINGVCREAYHRDDFGKPRCKAK